MGRHCAQCNDYVDRYDYSRNQWMKGDGYSRCIDCVNGSSSCCYECNDCGRTFNTSNELEMHRQVHRPRSVACPICGERRFRSGANAVQHVESGYCSGCRGANNARDQIYNFVNQQRTMDRYVSNVPRLTYDGEYDNSGVPDYPYTCPECNDRSFRHLSQLLQHRDQKHGDQRLLRY